MARKNPDRKVRELDKDFSLTATEGKIRESLAITLLLKNGYEVALPIVDNRYDIIVEKYSKFMRIQVKNLKLEFSEDKNNPLSNDQYVIRAFSSPGKSKKTYSKEDTDFIMGFNIETENFALIPIDKIPSSGIVKISVKCDRKQYFNSFKALEEFMTG